MRFWPWPPRRLRAEHAAALARIGELTAELQRLNVDRVAQASLIDGLRAHAAALDSAVARAYEPAVAECVKTRLHTRDEARQFAELVTERTGRLMREYQCKLCPRHPATTNRFWHIGNADPQYRGARNEESYAAGRPPELEDVFPWVGGTLVQQRGTIALRKKVWAEQDAAATKAHEAAFYAERDRREAAYRSTKGTT